MPQKKNPDAAELLRGKVSEMRLEMRRDAGRDRCDSHLGAISQASRAIGNHTAMLSMLKGLPLAYNKDMQEDKAALFDSLATAEAALQIACGVLSTLTPVPDRMRKALNSFMLATDLSEYLVRKGVPFRETHHVAGRAVQLAEDRGCALTDLSIDDLRGLHPLFTQDVMGVWDFEKAVERRDTMGGTSRRSVLAQVDALESWCAGSSARSESSA